MLTHKPYRTLLLFLALTASGRALAEEPQQGVMSDLRDAIVESEYGQKKKKQFDDLKDKLDERFVQPVSKLKAQFECSSGWRGDECEKLFPETREKIGNFRESVQQGTGSVAQSARDRLANLQEQAGRARTGLQGLLETEAEKAEKANQLRALMEEQDRKEQERIAALNARNLAEQQRMARQFAEEESRKQQAARKEAEEQEALAQHEAEVSKAVGLFLDVMGAAVNGYQSERARQQTYQSQQNQRQQEQLIQQQSRQQEIDRQNAEFAARKQQQEQQQALQRQRQFQDEARARQRIESGYSSGSSSSGGGAAPYCYKEEGINGRYVCK